MVERDVFDGLAYSYVRDEHIAEIAYTSIEPLGMPALVMEVGHFRPENAPLDNESRHAIIVPTGFGTRMQDKGVVTDEVTDEWAPNHHALRHASLARATGFDVIAFGFPDGDKVDGLPRSIRKEIADGNFSSYVRYMVQEVVDRGIESIDTDGYSLGGAIAPDFALACIEKGIKVHNLFLGAIANSDIEAGAIEVAKRNLSGTGNRQEREHYAETSVALSQELARHTMIQKGAGSTAVRAVVKRIASALRPTPFAFARGMGHGAIFSGTIKDTSTDPAQKLHAVRQKDPTVRIHLYSGADDKFLPVSAMQRIADDLGLPLEKFASETHALRDKLAIVNQFILSKYFKE